MKCWGVKNERPPITLCRLAIYSSWRVSREHCVQNSDRRLLLQLLVVVKQESEHVLHLPQVADRESFVLAQANHRMTGVPKTLLRNDSMRVTCEPTIWPAAILGSPYHLQRLEEGYVNGATPYFSRSHSIIWCRHTAPRAATPTHRSGNSIRGFQIGQICPKAVNFNQIREEFEF